MGKCEDLCEDGHAFAYVCVSMCVCVRMCMRGCVCARMCV